MKLTLFSKLSPSSKVALALGLTSLIVGFVAPAGAYGATASTTVGVPGPIGPAGPQGPFGKTGATGPQGPQGPQGPIGKTGATGPQGPAGVTGASGPAGPAGRSGVAGVVGAVGPQGPRGYTGLAGAAGTTGARGPVGATGPAGPIGPVGATGPAGPTGPAGAAGLDGAPGPAGPQGDPGPAGPQGSQGVPGLLDTATLNDIYAQIAVIQGAIDPSAYPAAPTGYQYNANYQPLFVPTPNGNPNQVPQTCPTVASMGLNITYGGLFVMADGSEFNIFDQAGAQVIPMGGCAMANATDSIGIGIPVDPVGDGSILECSYNCSNGDSVVLDWYNPNGATSPTAGH